MRGSALIEKEPYLSDATVNVLPFKPRKVYVISDSRLELSKAKAKGGNQGLETTPAERLKATEYSFKSGVELMHLMETCWQLTKKAFGIRCQESAG